LDLPIRKREREKKNKRRNKRDKEIFKEGISTGGATRKKRPNKKGSRWASQKVTLRAEGRKGILNAIGGDRQPRRTSGVHGVNSVRRNELKKHPKGGGGEQLRSM